MPRPDPDGDRSAVGDGRDRLYAVSVSLGANDPERRQHGVPMTVPHPSATRGPNAAGIGPAGSEEVLIATTPTGTGDTSGTPVEPPTGTASTTTTRIELPAATIAKVVLTLAILWLVGRLWTVLLLVFIALLIAAALDPIVGRLERRGWPRSASVALIVAVGVAALGGVGWLLVAPLAAQGRQLATDLPGYVEQAQTLVDANPDLFERARTAAAEA